MCELPLRRHDLVWVKPAAWADMLDAQSEVRHDPLVVAWAAHEWPLIMRRSLCDDAKGLVPVGLPLPPRTGKRRLALAVPPGEVVRTASPPLLADVAASAPKAWEPCIDLLLHLDSGVRTYGSLAWQHLTGLAYLTDRSDLDLLWRRQDEEATRTLLAGLWAIDCGAPMPIDGEIVAADGMAVNWRELRSGAAQVIGRRLDALTLVRSECFIAGGDFT